MSPKDEIYIKIFITTVFILLFLNTNFRMIEAMNDSMTFAGISLVVCWICLFSGLYFLWKSSLIKKINVIEE